MALTSPTSGGTLTGGAAPSILAFGGEKPQVAARDAQQNTLQAQSQVLVQVQTQAQAQAKELFSQSAAAASLLPASTAAAAADANELLEESFTPPEYFGIVECGVYRSNLPNPISFPFIKLLKIKTVLLLSADVPTKLVRTFFEENSFNVHHLGLESSKVEAESWKPLSDELVKDALELVLDARTHPVLLCDASGMHQIGTVIGCRRRLQLWSLNAASEYRSYAGVKTRYQYEQFIELFDVDLITLPLHLPKWFIQYIEMEEEELVELQELVAAGDVMKAGSLVLRDDMDVPKYRKYYYSDSIPLNSEEHVPKPRIQQLP